MDLPEFSKIDDYFINGEVDFVLNEAFPQEPTYSLQHLLEYRVKLLLQENIIIAGGECTEIPTSCIVKGMRKLSAHVKRNENIPLIFESEGYVSHKFRGRIFIRVANHQSKPVKLSSGVCIAYLILSPFSIQ